MLSCYFRWEGVHSFTGWLLSSFHIPREPMVLTSKLLFIWCIVMFKKVRLVMRICTLQRWDLSPQYQLQWDFFVVARTTDGYIGLLTTGLVKSQFTTCWFMILKKWYSDFSGGAAAPSAPTLPTGMGHIVLSQSRLDIALSVTHWTLIRSELLFCIPLLPDSNTQFHHISVSLSAHLNVHKPVHCNSFPQEPICILIKKGTLIHQINYFFTCTWAVHFNIPN